MRGIVLAIALFGLSAAARAEEGDAERARQAYSEGKAEYDLGHINKALDAFERAYRYRPVPALLFNIAQCHRLLGDLKSAAMTYRAYLRNDPNSPQASKARELLEQVETAMEHQNKAQNAQPQGLTTPPPAPPAAQPPSGWTAAAPKPAPAAAVAATPAPEPPPVPRQRLWSYVAGGGAVLALAGGTLFALKANSAASDLQSAPHDRAFIDSQEPAIRSDAGKANALLIGGVVLAVAAGALFAFDF